MFSVRAVVFMARDAPIKSGAGNFAAISQRPSKRRTVAASRKNPKTKFSSFLRRAT